MFHNNNFNYGMNNQNINFNMNNNFNNQISSNNKMNIFNNNMNNLININQNNNNLLNNIRQMNLMYNDQKFPIINNINIPNNNIFMNMNNNPNNFNFNNMNNHNYFLNQFNNMNLNVDIPQINQINNINNFNFLQNKVNSFDFEIEQNKNIQPKDLEVIKVIYNQMNNCISNKGFFCFLPYFGKKIPVFITSTEVLDDNFLKWNHEIVVSINYGKIKATINLDENNILFKSEEFKILIIKINSNNNLTKNNFLEFDESLYENNHIYILNYNEDKQYSTVSYGYLVKQVRQFLVYSCKMSSVGEPIINLENNKVIGMTVKKRDNYIGTFLKSASDEINKIKNQIRISLSLEFDNLDNKIYFLNNIEEIKNKDEIKKNYFDLKELNENNVKLYINGVKYKYQKYFTPKKRGKYNITLKFYEKIKDCSFMFYNCKEITSIDLSKFDNNKITNMNSMFGGCYSLKYIDFYSMDTKNVIDMAKMFDGCYNLNNLNLFDFNTEKVINMKKMFNGCSNLESIDLTNFNTKNVTDMSSMFMNTYNLRNLDLSSFRSDKFENIHWMFYWCNNLRKVDISNFDINKIINKKEIFELSSFSNSNSIESIYTGPKIIKINKNSFEEIKKQITSDSVKIIIA